MVQLHRFRGRGGRRRAKPAECPAEFKERYGRGQDAAESVAEIASSMGAEPNSPPLCPIPLRSTIYKAAEIPPAPQGYSILNISHMLESEHLCNLPSDVKKSSVLVALDAAGVDIKEVIQDAIRRDRALDGYERVPQRRSSPTGSTQK